MLVSFALWSPWMERYQQSWGKMILDSGAFSVFNSGKTIDLQGYADFAEQWVWRFENIAGLDDISGDWRQSLKNYEVVGFPTFHNTDPPELLNDLIGLARERGGWIGLGIAPVNGSRTYASHWVRDTLDRIPDDIHIHGWAMRAFLHLRRFNSVDSTNWFRDIQKVLTTGIPLPWLTPAEALEIIVKRYRREEFCVSRAKDPQMGLFGPAKE